MPAAWRLQLSTAGVRTAVPVEAKLQGIYDISIPPRPLTAFGSAVSVHAVKDPARPPQASDALHASPSHSAAHIC